MVSKYKQKKKKNVRNYEKSNEELNALIEKKIRNLLKPRKEENGKRASVLSKNADFRC